eukprot:552632_1
MSQSSSSNSSNSRPHPHQRYKRHIQSNTITFTPNRRRRNPNPSSLHRKSILNNNNNNTSPRRQVLTIRRNPHNHNHNHHNPPNNILGPPPIPSHSHLPLPNSTYPRTRNSKPKHRPPNTNPTKRIMTNFQATGVISILPDTNQTIMTVSDDTFRKLMHEQSDSIRQRNKKKKNYTKKLSFHTRSAHKKYNNRRVIIHKYNRHNNRNNNNRNNNRKRKRNEITPMGPQPPPEMISKSKTKTQGKMHDDIPPRDMIMNLPNQMMLHFENDSEFEIDADINYEIGKLNYAADIAGSDIDIDDGIEEGEISEGEIIEDGQVGTDKKKRKLNDIDDVYWKEVNNSDSGNECKSNKDIREQKSNAVKLKDNNDNNDNDNDVVIGVGVNKNSLVPYTPSSDEEDKVKNGTGGNDGGSVCLSEVSVPSAK